METITKEKILGIIQHWHKQGKPTEFTYEFIKPAFDFIRPSGMSVMMAAVLTWTEGPFGTTIAEKRISRRKDWEVRSDIENWAKENNMICVRDTIRDHYTFTIKSKIHEPTL